MKSNAISLLKELTEAHSVPGYEEEVRAIFVNELEECGDLSTDKNGSVFCKLGERGPKIMIAGHMDEVGFRVQNILPNGFVQFVAVGGWWGHTLLSQRVEILTQSGRKILGVISSQPPHFLSEAQRNKVMGLESMFIDVGASSQKEAELVFGLSLGDPIAPVSEFTQMTNQDYYMAKAFDNRVGMAGVIQAGKVLQDQVSNSQIVLTGTVQEEVGLRGAKTAASFIKPDVAIVLEGPPADDTPGFSSAEAQGMLGGGVQIRLHDPTAIMNPRLVALAQEVAETEGIMYQSTVRRSGGTDAGSFSLANEGVPSIVLGVPARYIHSHNAIIDINDQLSMVELVVALVKELDQRGVGGLTKYL